MDPFTMGMMGLQAYGALSGMFGARSAAARARLLREQAKNRMLMASDLAYQNAVKGLSSDVNSAAGIGGDAVRNATLNAGADAGASGVYGSTAVEGVRQMGLDRLAATIQGISSAGVKSLAQMRADAQAKAAEMDYGSAMSDMQSAQAQGAGAAEGMGSFLSNLYDMTKKKPAAVAANTARPSSPGITPTMSGPLDLTGAVNTFQAVQNRGRSVGPAINGQNNGVLPRRRKSRGWLLGRVLP